MKKLVPLTALIALACITFISCHHDHDMSITYNDEDGYYSMNAHFNKNKMWEVERYMDRMIGAATKMSFVKTRIDGELALENQGTFYIKKYPGHIKIKLDKEKNSEEAYETIREMCEGMTAVLED